MITIKSNQYKLLIYIITVCHLLAGCSDDLFGGDESRGSGNRITLSGEIDQLAVTRVNDSGFADGDVMGVYIVDYNGNTPGTLQPSGNRADNVRHTYDAANAKWNSAYDIYWKDDHTHIDVYGYYPFGSPESIDAYPFTVERDQSKPSEDGVMGGYEASDFLWGKVADVAPTDRVIRLPMAHRMANARVTLTEGTGFADGEWEQTERTVLVANLIRGAKINLNDGTVKAKGSVETTATVPARVGDEWRAIVVPQTVAAGTTLFTITVGGIPYKFSKNEAFTYTAGKMSNFTIRVDKKAETGQYTLTLVNESITPWESDLVSHDAEGKAYIVINTTRGHLKSSIIAANKDYTKLKNLKITGEIDATDFEFMRNEMTQLEALNLKDVKVYGTFGEQEWNGISDNVEKEGVIPGGAMAHKKNLLYLVLPDKLEAIGSSAFEDCTNLTGSLLIPEGVTRIATNAFASCSNLNGLLSLPSTLKYISNGAFTSCDFTCELILPSSLKYISENSFSFNSGFYGNLVLPDELEYIGGGAFNDCSGFIGDLRIPQKISTISDAVFNSCKFDGTLILHDGITKIGEVAFAGNSFKGELILPNNLTIIGRGAFTSCYFSGELNLPKSLISIGSEAFLDNNRLTGILTIPDGISVIPENTFYTLIPQHYNLTLFISS